MNTLFEGLHKTNAENVVVKVSDVIELIGVENTEKLHLGILEIQVAMTTKKNSILPRDKRIKKEGYGRFNRLDLIKAIQSESSKRNNNRTVITES